MKFPNATRIRFLLAVFCAAVLATPSAMAQIDPPATKSDIAQVQADLGGLQTRMTSLEVRMGVLESGMRRMETRMDHVESRVNAMDTRLARVEEKIDILIAVGGATLVVFAGAILGLVVANYLPAGRARRPDAR